MNRTSQKKKGKKEKQKLTKSSALQIAEEKRLQKSEANWKRRAGNPDSATDGDNFFPVQYRSYLQSDPSDEEIEFISFCKYKNGWNMKC